MRPVARGTAVVAGLLLDRIVGEPPTAAHPVAWLGRGLGQLEARTHRDNRAAGVGHLGVAVVLAALVARPLRDRWSGLALAVWCCSAGRMLGRAATEVGDALDAGDLEAARSLVGGLVGRETGSLDEAEVARAAVETVAENTVDAVTATVFWAAVAGPTGVVVHRVVNTLDAMVGHRNERYQAFGWASARADDLLNWLPARLSVLAVGAARPGSARAALAAAWNDGGRHPSPNGGRIEAAFAGSLGFTLGGANAYPGAGHAEVRGPLGNGPAPTPADIARTVRLAEKATVAFAAGTVVAVLAQGRKP